MASFESNAISFEKYHGAKNDFVFFSFASFPQGLTSREQLQEFARQVCDRNSGIGADGIVLYRYDEKAEIAACIINSDGTFAQTCGNALRCLGLKSFRDSFWDGKTTLKIKRLPLEGEGIFAQILNLQGLSLSAPSFLGGEHQPPRDAQVSLAIGRESLVQETAVSLLQEIGLSGVAAFVQLENPHWVFLSPDFKNFSREEFIAFGKKAQQEAGRFELPVANIGMLTFDKNLVGTTSLSLTVFERGAGYTQCCGSGAVAARAALEFFYRGQNKDSACEFVMPGGVVSVREAPASWILQGEAAFVFAGRI